MSVCIFTALEFTSTRTCRSVRAHKCVRAWACKTRLEISFLLVIYININHNIFADIVYIIYIYFYIVDLLALTTYLVCISLLNLKVVT